MKSLRISNSFSPGEIEVAHFILHKLLMGGDPRMIVRHPSFGSLTRKIDIMKRRAEEAKKKRKEASSEKPNPPGGDRREG